MIVEWKVHSYISTPAVIHTVYRFCRSEQNKVLFLIFGIFFWFWLLFLGDLRCLHHVEGRWILRDRNRPTEANHRQPVQNYVYTHFLVKIKFNFASFGYFWIYLCQGLCMSEEFVQVFIFFFLKGGGWGQKVQMFGVIKFWTSLHKVCNIY